MGGRGLRPPSLPFWHLDTVAASISGSFAIGQYIGGGVKEAPELAEEPPTAFVRLTIGWQIQAAASDEEVLSCGTTAQTRSRAAAPTSCDVKVGDGAVVLAMAGRSSFTALAMGNRRGHSECEN